MKKTFNIKSGIKLHIINEDKYKTNVVAIFLTTKLNRENITKEALLPAVLRMGNSTIKTQQELNKELEEMYGANFNCGIEKKGDNHILKFYIETLNDEYTLDRENILEKSINFIFNSILNPLIKNESFKEEYVDGEKNNLNNIIQGKIDNKTTYAYSRCIEEMYKDKAYGLSEYGYSEDLEDIHGTDLYGYYKDFLQCCKIDIFISGKITNEKEVKEIITSAVTNKYSIELQDRTPNFELNSIEEYEETTPKTIEEKMDVTQGKLVIGLKINNSNKSAANNLYNAILGGGANSKLFQNVREKSSLAYTAGSGYLKTKNIIVIRCGIEIKNYNKAVDIIKEQLKHMQEGKFTDKDINDAKELIIGGLKAIEDEQTSEIAYEFSKELSKEKTEINDLIDQIRNINKKEIEEVAKDISISTIYFLRN